MKQHFCAQIDDDSIERYAMRRLPDSSIRDHLDTCPRCQARATEYRSYISVLRRALYMLQPGGSIGTETSLKSLEDDS